MVGTVSLMEPADRLCVLQGRLDHPVTFGFGLIGKVDQGGSFRLERAPVNATEWKSRKISVHMGGRILMMKSLAKEQETVRTDVRAGDGRPDAGAGYGYAAALEAYA